MIDGKPTSVRLPTELKRELRIEAAKADRSLTGEIVHRLERSLSEGEAEQPSQ